MRGKNFFLQNTIFVLILDTIEQDVNQYLQNKDTTKVESSKGNIVDLVRTPVMRMYTFAIGFNWFLCGLCFFGVSQFIGQLGTVCEYFSSISGICVSYFQNL